MFKPCFFIIVIFFIQSCEDPDLADFCNDPDPCFSNSIMSWDYAFWDLKKEEWVKVDFLQNYNRHRFASYGSDFYVSSEHIYLRNKRIGPEHEFTDITLNYDRIHDTLTSTISYIFNDKIFFHSYHFLYDKINQVSVREGDISEKPNIADEDSIYHVLGGNNRIFFKYFHSSTLKEYDYYQEVVKETNIDTNRLPMDNFIKLIGDYGLYFNEDQKIIEFININNGIKSSFQIETANANHFVRIVKDHLINARSFESAIFLSCFNILTIDGKNTGGSSIIKYFNGTIELLPLPGIFGDSFTINNGNIYLEMSLPDDESTPYPNRERNRLYKYELSTGKITNMNGGLCCNCTDEVNDILDIESTNDYLVVSGYFCRAGMDESINIIE